jgi:hypothetical protein
MRIEYCTYAKTIYAQDLIPVVIQKACLFFYVDFQRNPSAFEKFFCLSLVRDKLRSYVYIIY